MIIEDQETGKEYELYQKGGVLPNSHRIALAGGYALVLSPWFGVFAWIAAYGLGVDERLSMGIGALTVLCAPLLGAAAGVLAVWRYPAKARASHDRR
jgi:hypothetical protein